MRKYSRLAPRLNHSDLGVGADGSLPCFSQTIVHYAQAGGRCTAGFRSCLCLFRFISAHGDKFARCPLYPRQRPLIGCFRTSANCQQQTSADQRSSVRPNKNSRREAKLKNLATRSSKSRSAKAI